MDLGSIWTKFDQITMRGLCANGIWGGGSKLEPILAEKRALGQYGSDSTQILCANYARGAIGGRGSPKVEPDPGWKAYQVKPS